MPKLLFRKKTVNFSKNFVSARVRTSPKMAYFNKIEFRENKWFGDRICFKIKGKERDYLSFCDYRKEVIEAAMPHIQMGGEIFDITSDKDFMEKFQKEADISLAGWRDHRGKIFWLCEIRNPSTHSIAETFSMKCPCEEQTEIFRRLTGSKTAPN